MGQNIFQKLLRKSTDLEAIQKKIAKRVVVETRIERLNLIAGCDVAYKGDIGCAACALLTYPTLEIREVAKTEGRVDFPYIPGFLAFRESPLIIATLKRLKNRPHCLMADGHGIAHPKGAGLACHLGVVTGIPTIGCAKTWLIGNYVEPDLEAGSISPLSSEGKRIGYVVRTRSQVKPIFVSPGHLVDAKTAVEIILNCSVSFRTPEPLRIAHIESKRGFTKY